MKEKTLQIALAAALLGAALVGGHWFVHFLAGTFGWGSPPKVELTSQPRSSVLKPSDEPESPDVVPALPPEPTEPAESAEEDPAPMVAAVDEPLAPEPSEVETEAAEVETEGRSPVSDREAGLFAASREQSEPRVNPNTFVVTADPSRVPSGSDSPQASQEGGAGSDVGNSDPTGPGSGNGELPLPPELAPTPGSNDLARADAAVGFSDGAASASASLSTGPTGETPAVAAEMDASLAGIADLSLEASVPAASAEPEVPAAPASQAQGLYSNALAGSVSGLIGGMESPATGPATRVQIRHDNRVVIGPSAPSADPVVPNVPVTAGAVTPPLEVPLPVTNAAPLVNPTAGVPAANVGVNPPAGVAVDAGSSGIGINAGQLGIRINTGLR